MGCNRIVRMFTTRGGRFISSARVCLVLRSYAPITLVVTSLDRIENVFIEMRKVLERRVPTMLAFSILHPVVDTFTITSLVNVRRVGYKAEPRNSNNIERLPLFGKSSAP
jgi:hypothetical protein